MDVLVWFGGGGSLGAFDAGVWSALAPRLRAVDARVVAFGGASIGAVNAAVLAQQAGAADLGAARLEALWREELATPSFPFNGPLAWSGVRDASSWNGVLTGLLVGNRRLYRTEAMHWTPVHGLQRPQHPLMDRRGQWTWLEQRIGEVAAMGPQMPLLCAAAVDILAGDVVLFDNAAAPMPVDRLAAGSAIPLLFEPVEIDGRPYWDGEMSRESALPAFLARARALGLYGAGRPSMLIAVDHMSRGMPRMPGSDLEIADRVLELLLHGKTRLDAAASADVDHVLRIEREPMPHDGISGQFDYAPERIGELVDQGAAHAGCAWDAEDALGEMAGRRAA